MEEFNRKHRALKCFPLRTLHQNNNNVISKRKRNTQENGECTLKRLKNCHFDNATTMDLDTIEGRKDTSMKCIFCRKWSGSLEDFAWHVSQAHGIPAQVAKCIMNKLVLSKGRGKIEDSENAVGIHKFLDTHYECIPQVVWDAQDVSDCE